MQSKQKKEKKRAKRKERGRGRERGVKFQPSIKDGQGFTIHRRTLMYDFPCTLSGLLPK